VVSNQTTHSVASQEWRRGTFFNYLFVIAVAVAEQEVCAPSPKTKVGSLLRQETSRDTISSS
jgi:hypothetical protein